MKDHLDNFNQNILDLQGVGVKIDNEDQVIILLCSLPNLYENFVDTMLYGRGSIFISDVKDAMQSKELKRKVSGSKEDSGDASLVVSRGRNKERDDRSRGKSRSKSMPGGMQCFTVKKKDTSEKIAHRGRREMKIRNQIVMPVLL